MPQCHVSGIERRTLARAALDLAADEARRFYNGLYHQFTVALPDQPRLVESLFMTLTHAPAAVVEPTAPAAVSRTGVHGRGNAVPACLSMNRQITTGGTMTRVHSSPIPGRSCM